MLEPVRHRIAAISTRIDLGCLIRLWKRRSSIILILYYKPAGPECKLTHPDRLGKELAKNNL